MVKMSMRGAQMCVCANMLADMCVWVCLSPKIRTHVMLKNACVCVCECHALLYSEIKTHSHCLWSRGTHAGLAVVKSDFTGTKLALHLIAVRCTSHIAQKWGAHTARVRVKYISRMGHLKRGRPHSERRYAGTMRFEM